MDNRLDLIESEGLTDACMSCKYLREYKQHHEYGIGHAAETLHECIAEHDSQCIRVEEIGKRVEG